MTKHLFIWDLERNRKVKIKEIRHYYIVSETFEGIPVYYVDGYYGYGFTGGKLRLFKGTKDECVEFIDLLTERPGKEQESDDYNISKRLPNLILRKMVKEREKLGQ